MNNLPIGAFTPRQQRQLYELLSDQVKSYHRYYHMGDNSSVPTELAQELLHSIWYTLDAAGDCPDSDLRSRLESGQEALSEKWEQAKQLHRLVSATVPNEQSQCHWECLRDLGRYLAGYDHLHFAHRTPDGLFYPLLAPIPEGLVGLDSALFSLNCLWLENQILDAFPEGAIAALNRRLPPDYWEAPQNLCEQPIWNGLGKTLLDQPLNQLWMDDRDWEEMKGILQGRSYEEIRQLLDAAASRLSCHLGLSDHAAAYASGAVGELLPRLWAALPEGNLSGLWI